MPRMENNGGDVLARGAASATFRPAGQNVSREKWDAMWDGFDPEAFKNAPPPTDPNAVKANSMGGYENSGDANGAQTRTSGSGVGTAVSSK